MLIEIDSGSGFCNGVTRAIKAAEEELAQAQPLYCLGDIVHNGRECERLHELGLITVDKENLSRVHDTKLLLRAHGEPPSTYIQAAKQNIEIIDATCPVVLHLQKRIKADYDADNLHKKQIVIYGKNGHAEVVGLVGQTEGTAIVIETLEDAQQLDFSKDIQLYSQTTKSLEGFREIVSYIESHMQNGAVFNYFDTICRQVANRMPRIREFAEHHDVILFVSGKKSSNGKVLFSECLAVNQRSHMIDSVDEIDFSWFNEAQSVGICGATSTPKWLMEDCRNAIIAHP
ncbi:MAG: 4-hydroxy-3-methylbut-2-enyl diphosphate reductase [Prevotellaceae bacterium]|nr:4-hydroxy-3-methylbut-2-enyl diphosphate reductase [Candidatus Colivivens caballi]